MKIIIPSKYGWNSMYIILKFYKLEWYSFINN